MAIKPNNKLLGGGSTQPLVSPTSTDPTRITPASPAVDTSYSGNSSWWQNAANGFGNFVNKVGNVVSDVKNAVGTVANNVGNAFENLSYSANSGTASEVSPVTASAPAQNSSGAETGGGVVESPVATDNPSEETVGNYYDYLKEDVPDTLKDIYNDDIIYQDQQNAALVEDIEGIRTDGIAAAGTQRDDAYAAATTEKNNTYTYADKVLMETLGFNEEQYNALIASINQSKESGLELAEETKAILVGLAEDTKAQLYKAAEAARVREYEQAEITRQRGIVDASSAYAQNRASYGANAEALASMGLTGGGYSDYLDAQAYAAQRGDVQQVNAEAEASKRAARYAEDETKINADTTYAANVKEAELQYAQQVGDVNATYEAGLRDANLWKSEADFNAEQTANDTKYQADSKYNDRIYDADTTYNTNVASINREADLAIAEANAATAQAKHQAEEDYKKGLLSNEEATRKYKEEMLYYFIDKATSGSYTSEQIAAIAEQMEFSDAEKQMILDGLTTYTNTKAEEEAAYAKGVYTEILTAANSGAYSADQVRELAGEYGLSEEQTNSLVSAANTYEANRQTANFNTLMSAYDADGFETIKTALNNGDITQAQYNTVLATYQQAYYDNCASNVDYDFASVNTSEIDNALSRGYITQDQYNNLKAKYNAGVSSAITAGTILYSNGAALNKDAAQAVINELNATGWLSDENKNNINSKFNAVYNAPAATEEDDGGGCFADGTLITMADGSTKPIEKLEKGDKVIGINHETGEIGQFEISMFFHFDEPAAENRVLNLVFDDGTEVETIDSHAFFDITLNRYVDVGEDTVEEVVGHKFYSVKVTEGGYEPKELTLVSYSSYLKHTGKYAIVSNHAWNCFGNTLINIPPMKEVFPTKNKRAAFLNIFEFGENLKYDEEKKAADIAKYGLLPYEALAQYCTPEVFYGANAQYYQVAIAKGFFTVEDLLGIMREHEEEINNI